MEQSEKKGGGKQLEPLCFKRLEGKDGYTGGGLLM